MRGDVNRGFYWRIAGMRGNTGRGGGEQKEVKGGVGGFSNV
jgi:hypothetical protein